MDIKKAYGEETSDNFKPGDIVEWKAHYGVILEIKSKIVSNRLVSISTVVPVEDSGKEMEFFSFSLKLISRAGCEEQELNS